MGKDKTDDFTIDFAHNCFLYFNLNCSKPSLFTFETSTIQEFKRQPTSRMRAHSIRYLRAEVLNLTSARKKGLLLNNATWLGGGMSEERKSKAKVMSFLCPFLAKKCPTVIRE